MPKLFSVVVLFFIISGCSLITSPEFAWDGVPYGTTRAYLGIFANYPETSNKRQLQGLPPGIEPLVMLAAPLVVIHTAVDIPLGLTLDTLLLPLSVPRYLWLRSE